ncbi:MAG: spondin domain-containing protein [Myxococcota bacterium]|nr:spondin domain-containing protein [Myxococcota bacterium]
MLKLSLLAAGLTAALGACGTDDSEPDATDPTTPTTFKLRIENVAPWTVLKSGTQAMKVDGTTGAAGPGAAFEIAFTAGRNQKLSFATMLGQSNDWFFSAGPAGLSLYNEDGNPIAGDITNQVHLYDAGTEIDQEPGVGNATGPRQSAPDFGPIDPDPTVRRLAQAVPLTAGGTFTLPPIAAMVRVTLTPGAGGQFVLRIENVSTATTLVTSAGASGIGISPLAWALHTQDSPLFSVGAPDRGQGLEQIAEAGRVADLGSALRTLTGAATPVSPGVFAVHADPEPLYALGLADLGLGLVPLAEDGNTTPLFESIRTSARLMELSQVGTYDIPVDAAQMGPARPGDAFELTVTGTPGEHVSFASMFGMSNDWFFATRPGGIALFDAQGVPRRGDVSADIALYDAGSEIDQELAIGPDTGPQQAGPDTGAPDPITLVRELSTTAYPHPASTHLRVTLEPM